MEKNGGFTIQQEKNEFAKNFPRNMKNRIKAWKRNSKSNY